MNDKSCTKCGGPFGRYDIALHRKMVNRGAEEFMCIHCLAEWFKVSEELLLEKAEHFRKSGCTLFYI